MVLTFKLTNLPKVGGSKKVIYKKISNLEVGLLVERRKKRRVNFETEIIQRRVQNGTEKSFDH